MAKQLSRKELLKSPDEFITLTGKVVEYYKSHQNQFKVGSYVVLIAAVLIAGFHFWKTSVNQGGQTAYDAAVKSLQAGNQASGAVAQDLQRAGQLFSEVVSDYSMSDAARLAEPQLAHVKVLEKDYAAAISAYEKFQEQMVGKPVYETMATLSLASCYEASGDLDNAIKLLTPLLSGDSDEAFKPTAMWNLARIYGLKGEKDRQQEILRDLVEQFKDSPFTPMAQARL